MPRTEGAAVLARHGIPADADAERLEAELAARGWAVAVEETGRSGGPGVRRQHRAVARRPATPGDRPAWHGGDRPLWYEEHVQATGHRAAALARVLAKALERDEDDGRKPEPGGV